MGKKIPLCVVQEDLQKDDILFIVRIFSAAFELDANIANIANFLYHRKTLLDGYFRKSHLGWHSKQEGPCCIVVLVRKRLNSSTICTKGDA